MYKNKKTFTNCFNPKTFWMNEDKLKQAYQSGKISHWELITELFDRLKKEEYGKGENKFKNEELSHFADDEDFGEAWKEMIVKEYYPQYFFKH